MRLPRLRGDDPPVAHALLAYELAAGLLRFQTNVLIAGNPLAGRQPRGSQYLDAMADRENPLALPVACRSEEHTSELQPPCNLARRLLLATITNRAPKKPTTGRTVPPTDPPRRFRSL